MKIRFLGAAGTVTGSCHVLEAAGRRFAIDCGMHQGNEAIERRNQDMTVYRPKEMDFFIVTHAHIDHSGLLPRMIKTGFSGPIYVTPPTRDLLEIMLADSAHIQETEAEWRNRRSRRRGGKRAEPLYTMADAEAVMPLLRPVEYGRDFSPAPGITARFNDAGHILGSAFVELWIKENGQDTKLVFSGDLGRPNQLLVNDPSTVAHADYLFLEGTYGDRNHKNETQSRAELAEAIARSYALGEKVIIPAFAVERTQEVLFCLNLLRTEGKLPTDMPVFVDSPLAIKATEIFRRHPEYLDLQTRELLDRGEDPLALPNLRYTQTSEQSRAINDLDGPAVVISASGMCNAGRIKHHLRHNLWRPGASIVFVGYQAMGTPGRRIVDGASMIRIFGEDVTVSAKIYTIGGFSSHAGQSQILQWLDHLKDGTMEVFLIHGEEKALATLAGIIREKYRLSVRVPDYLDEYTLRPGVEPKVAADPEKAWPRIDWPFLLDDTEGKFAVLRKRLDALSTKPWTDQTDLRQRLLEVNRHLTEMLSEI
ncbi:MBL fold metallo-hydrolase RNA specificity domain-containing protein [Desulfolutivibrio sulfoxidireducens]|uniref:MBL fold metallo-hydrolase RNA specificity domain-containing protein n=1 Tax=Desulfolutivibrio sulfoxidireducens TaxID=2773299 RepID=UPI00159DF72D|nr:MBL fold metallo-hydrolase [Desulfolutivibrio sulfoxidireducens]QLA16452.1 MBL fold metallo-hydrolase [Desulfolutivibrio sulfoxidireducens]QLA19668.1 MBL fold metallo-hydrolase [Desulfolutivibrio sulfoxidireducens]